MTMDIPFTKINSDKPVYGLHSEGLEAIAQDICIPSDFILTNVRLAELAGELGIFTSHTSILFWTSTHPAITLPALGIIGLLSLANGLRTYRNKKQGENNKDDVYILNYIKETFLKTKDGHFQDDKQLMKMVMDEVDICFKKILEKDYELQKKYSSIAFVENEEKELTIRFIWNKDYKPEDPSENSLKKMVKFFKSKIVPIVWDGPNISSYVFWIMFIYLAIIIGTLGAGALPLLIGVPLAVGYGYLSLKCANWLHYHPGKLNTSSVIGQFLLSQTNRPSVNMILNFLRFPLILPCLLLYILIEKPITTILRRFSNDPIDRSQLTEEKESEEVRRNKKLLEEEGKKDAARMIKTCIVLSKFDVARKHLETQRKDMDAFTVQNSIPTEYKNNFAMVNKQSSNGSILISEEKIPGLNQVKTPELRVKELIGAQWDEKSEWKKKRLWSATRYFALFVSAGVGGYIVPQFIAWLVTAVLGITAISAAVATGLGVAFFVIAGIVAIYKVVCRYEEQTELSKKIKKDTTELMLKDMNNKHPDLINLRRKYEEKCRIFNKKINECKQNINIAKSKGNITSTLAKNLQLQLNKWAVLPPVPKFDKPNSFNDIKSDGPSKYSNFKKWGIRTLTLLMGIQTGILLVRFLAVEGQIPFLPYVAPFLLAAMPQVAMALLITFAVVGIVWGIFKVHEYHVKKREERAKHFLENLSGRKMCLEQEIKYYKELVADNDLNNSEFTKREAVLDNISNFVKTEHLQKNQNTSSISEGRTESPQLTEKTLQLNL